MAIINFKDWSEKLEYFIQNTLEAMKKISLREIKGSNGIEVKGNNSSLKDGDITLGLTSSTQTDISKGVTAESWGDHKQEGYLTDDSDFVRKSLTHLGETSNITIETFTKNDWTNKPVGYSGFIDEDSYGIPDEVTYAYVTRIGRSNTGGAGWILSDHRRANRYLYYGSKATAEDDLQWKKLVFEGMLDKYLTSSDLKVITEGTDYKSMSAGPDDYESEKITLFKGTTSGGGWPSSVNFIATFLDSECRGLQLINEKDKDYLAYRGANCGGNWGPLIEIASQQWVDAKGYVTTDTKPKNSTITISAGTDLSTGGNFTLNQSNNKTITLNVQSDKTGNTSNSLVKRDGTKINSAGGFFETSDIRTKKNIKPLPQVDLQSLINLPIEFDRKSDDSHSIGVGAQELEKIAPELISEDKEGIKRVNYGKLSVLALSGLKRVVRELEETKKRLDKIEEIILNK